MTDIASEQTGMNVSIGNVRLKFPLDLSLGDVLVTQPPDTLLDVKSATVDIGLLPLFQGRVAINGLELADGKLNTLNLIESTEVKGRVGRLSVKGHGIDLRRHAVSLGEVALYNSDLSVRLLETKEDTTSTTTPWTIDVEQLAVNTSKVNLTMNNDSLKLGFELSQASATNARLDLAKGTYALGTLDWKGAVDSAPWSSPIALRASDIHFEGSRLTTGDLSLKAAESVLSARLDVDFNTFSSQPGNGLNMQIHALLNKNDITRLAPQLPTAMMNEWPDEPLELTADVSGDMTALTVDKLTATLPSAFTLTAEGSIGNIDDFSHLNADLTFAATTRDLRFATAALDRETRRMVRIPKDMKADGTLKATDGNYLADLKTLVGRGNVSLKGRYNSESENYSVNVDARRLPLQQFLPTLGLSPLTATIEARGRGFDLLSPSAMLTAKADIGSLSYDQLRLDCTQLVASLKNGKMTGHLNGDNDQLRGNIDLQALTHRQGLEATVSCDLDHLDLHALQLADTTFMLALCGHVDVTTDLKDSHRVQGLVSDIGLEGTDYQYHPTDLVFTLLSEKDTTGIVVDTGDLHLDARSGSGYQKLLTQADSLINEGTRQWQARRIDQTRLRERLPDAHIRLSAGQDNILYQFLSTNMDYHYEDIQADLRSSHVNGLDGYMKVHSLLAAGVQLDAIDFRVQSERDSTSYHINIKNNKNNPQYVFNAFVDGFLTENGSQIATKLYDERGDLGIDVGLAATLEEEGVRFSLTDRKPILGFVSFTANDNNYVYVGDDSRVSADLVLKADDGTGIQVYTNDDDETVLQDITVALNRFDLARILSVVPYTPDISGLMNGDFHVIQTADELSVSSNLAIESMAYADSPIGNVSSEFVYIPKNDGSHFVDGLLMMDNEEVATLSGSYSEAGEFDATLGLVKLPLSLVNGFIPDRIVGLRGSAEGDLSLRGTLSRPLVDGEVMLTSSALYSEPYGVTLRFADDPVRIEKSNLVFENFELFANNDSPLNVVGHYDFSDFDHMSMDIRMRAQNFLLIDAKENPRSEAFGKAYVNFFGTMNGPVERLTMRGQLDVLGTTNLSYILRDSELANDTQLDELVKFVNFEDTTTIVTIERPPLTGFTMDLNVNVDEAAHVFCALNTDKSNYIDIYGGGNLRLRYLPTDDLALTGRYTLESGKMKYSLPVIPLKTFNIAQGSYIEFTGDPMNPTLSIQATENVKATVGEGEGTGRPVDFTCGVKLSQTLNNLGLSFIIDAPSDNTVRDELNTMSAEERGKIAITMLASGMYLTDGNTGNFTMNSALSSFLQSEINNIAGSAMRSIGLDLSMGIDNATTASGQMHTDYNFQFAKRLWNNRLSFIVGGKVSTGSDADQRDDSFFDNVELQYRLNQNASKYLRVFYENNSYDWLEGVIGQYGAGFLWKRKLQHFSDIFRFKNTTPNAPIAPADSTKKERRMTE